MPHTSDYPKIFVGSSTLPINKLIEALKTWLTDAGHPAHFIPFDFLKADVILSEQELQHVGEADFCLFFFTQEDLQQLNEPDASTNANKRDFLLFLSGYLLATLGTERVLFARPNKLAIPLIPSLKNIEINSFNTEETDFKKSLRIISNKLSKKINTLGNRARQEFPKAPEEIKDLKAHYTIHILNENGDAIVKRENHMEVLEDYVGTREHRIFSDTSGNSFKGLKLKAKDGKNRELSVEKIYDTPVRKEFKILFRNPLSKGDRLEYSYSFNWPAMFPPEGSNFTLKSTADKIFFDLILPKSWDLLYARVIEKRRDGATSKRIASFKQIKEINEGEYIRYCYQLKEINKSILESQVFWEWKLKE